MGGDAGAFVDDFPAGDGNRMGNFIRRVGCQFEVGAGGREHRLGVDADPGARPADEETDRNELEGEPAKLRDHEPSAARRLFEKGIAYAAGGLCEVAAAAYLGGSREDPVQKWHWG